MCQLCLSLLKELEGISKEPRGTNRSGYLDVNRMVPFLFNMQPLEHVGLTNSLQQAFQHCYFNRQLSQRFRATIYFHAFVLMAGAV